LDDVTSDPVPVASGLGDRETDALLDVAETAIRRRLSGRSIGVIDEVDVPASLQASARAFVTLHVADRLNGCVGSLDGTEPLADSIADLAVKAGFLDPRLPPLRAADLTRLRIEISLLSDLVEVPARSRTELLQHVRPHRHGLVIRSGVRRAVFLPVVWRQLPSADQFIDRLLGKAGLPPAPWPDDLVADVFTTTTIQRSRR